LIRLLLLLPRLPPISTLFPYTTLFRSVGAAVAWCGRAPRTGRLSRPLAHGLLAALALVLLGWAALTIRQERIWHDSVTLWSRAADRKSTRLNSSHVSISYAVFCLKKKT